MGCLTYTTAMPRGGVFDVSFLVLSSLAILFGFIAYAKDPSLPAVGVRNGPPGSQRLTLAERWNGTSWTIQPT